MSSSWIVAGALVLAGVVGYLLRNWRKGKVAAGRLKDLSKDFEALTKFNEKQRKARAKERALQEASDAVRKANDEARKAVNLADYLNSRRDNN